jgi:hypothetical protein
MDLKPSEVRRRISILLRGRAARAFTIGLILFPLAVFAFPLTAQEENGPMTGPAPVWEPAPRPAAKRPPTTSPAPKDPAPAHHSSGLQKDAPPSIPPERIIQQFAQHESEFKVERDNFTYTQTFVVQSLDEGGQPDGEYRMTSDITFTPKGERYENVINAPQSTLERFMLTEEDFDDLRNVQPFVLTREDLPKYDVTYVGREKVDEIGTYVFDVAPKVIEKKQRYFQGRVWVDDRDLEIVKSYGKAVPDIIKKSGDSKVYPHFTTYRENIEGHFWFPTYTYANETLHFGRGNDIPMRMWVRYENYKRFRSSGRIVPGTATPTDAPKIMAPPSDTPPSR